MDKIKKWLYVPSNRSAVVAELSAIAIALGHIADKSLPISIAIAPAVYGIVHLVFPDFTLTPAEIGTIAVDAVKVAAFLPK